MSEGFTFFASYHEALRELPDDQRLQLYDAIVTYGLEGDEVQLTGIPRAMFALIKPVMDKGKARARAGKHGGESKTQAKRKQTESKTQANGKQTGSDKDKDKDKDKEYTPPLPPPRGGIGRARACITC